MKKIRVIGGIVNLAASWLTWVLVLNSSKATYFPTFSKLPYLLLGALFALVAIVLAITMIVKKDILIALPILVLAFSGMLLVANIVTMVLMVLALGGAAG